MNLWHLALVIWNMWVYLATAWGGHQVMGVDTSFQKFQFSLETQNLFLATNRSSCFPWNDGFISLLFEKMSARYHRLNYQVCPWVVSSRSDRHGKKQPTTQTAAQHFSGLCRPPCTAEVLIHSSYDLLCLIFGPPVIPF